MDYQPINNIAEICSAHHISDAVLSPGSRNAPLTYSFVRHNKIKTYSISDERSAAFIALGISLRSQNPVALVCTSGSAALNYAPAVAEAFFQQVPLIIFTADRPPEWIDQLDGQTIRQENIYGSHVKKSFTCPVDLTSTDAIWHLERIINEAIILATDGICGPVHINIPFREPFYPDKKLEVNIREPKIISKAKGEMTIKESDWNSLILDWRKYKNKLMVGGQMYHVQDSLEIIGHFSSTKNIPLVGDVISNLHGLTNNISLADVFIANQPNETKEALRPDLLITFGKSLISKNLKLYLRNFQPKAHWHIQENGYVADTFQSLTRIVPISFINFLKSLDNIVEAAPVPYLQLWSKLQQDTVGFVPENIGDQTFSEFKALHTIFDNLPIACDIHLANSMPVRWANMYGFNHTRQQVEIFCNRGTSGIDGCTSTAIGSAIKSNKTTLLITGDMAFFYDRNAFWNKYVPANLRIIVLNNHGGGIFDIIDGPSSQPEHGEYFITDQPLSAKPLANEFGLKYFHCKSLGELSKGLDKFWVRSENAKILEIETSISNNTKVLKKLKREIKQIWS